MTLREMIEAQGMTMYSFAKKAGLPVNVLMYMANHQVDLCKCQSEHIYRAAKTLNVSMESLVELGFRIREQKALEKAQKEAEQPAEKQA